MKKLIFATGNENKMKEIRMILADCGYEILSMKEAGIQADIVEDGKTFEENAIIKAEAIRKMTNCLVLADDSGLEVDYLDKAPGIYSARFMGEDTSYRIKNKAIIDKLAGVPDSVIQRAKELVEELSDADITAAVKDLTAPKKKQKITYDQVDMAQMSLFDTVQDNDIIEEIKGLEIGNLTPMEALNILYNLQNKIKNRW